MERPVVLRFPSFNKPSLQISRFSIISASSRSSSSSQSSSSPFIVDYLIEEIGIPREVALKASKSLRHLKTSKKPDSVVEFLRGIGLSQSQLSTTILRRPVILTSDVNNNLVPRIDLFKSLGASEKEIPELVVSSAICFGNSLDRRLIPAVNFLRGILKDDEKVRNALKRCPWILTNDPQKIPLRNLEFLREKGMDESSISSLVFKSPIVLVFRLELLISACETVEEIGLSAEDASFAHALHLVIVGPNANFSKKFEILRSFGFGKSSLYKLLKRIPMFFRIKDSYMKRKLDFFINEVGLDPETLMKRTFQMNLSLERSLIPRYKLLRSLQSEGLIPNEVDFSKAFCLTTEVFFNEYVNKFKDANVSDLLEAYEELSLEDSKLKQVPSQT